MNHVRIAIEWSRRRRPVCCQPLRRGFPARGGPESDLRLAQPAMDIISVPEPFNSGLGIDRTLPVGQCQGGAPSIFQSPS